MTPARPTGPDIAALQIALEQRPSALRAVLDRIHAADLAEWAQEIERSELRRILDLLQVEERAALIAHGSEALKETLAAVLDPPELVAVIDELAPDDVVDLLAYLSDSETEAVLRQVDLERARGLRKLAAYEPDSAGGIMTTDFAAVEQGTRVGDVIKALRKETQDDEGLGVYVLDGSGAPVGFVSDRDLLTSPIHSTVDEVMEREVVTANAEQDQEEVAQTFLKYDIQTLPVVDGRGAMVGLVTADDVLDVLTEEAEEDLLKLVGTAPEEQTRLPILRRVRQRLPLMAFTVVVGLATAVLLDSVLGAETSGASDLLRYIPIVIGLAGNVGVQSSTILVRGQATGEVSPERERWVLLAEVGTGTIVGALCGAVSGGVAWYLEAQLAFGLAVAVAIFVAVAWAAFLGALVPIACRRGGIDPAIVAGPFLIAMSDLSGTAIFIGVARLILASGGGGMGA
jgi:magnesium transporter